MSETLDDVSSRAGASFLLSKVHILEVTDQEWFLNKFGHYVRAIVGAGDLDEIEVATPYPLLDP